MTQENYEPILTKSRWLLLKRPEDLAEKQEVKLRDLLLLRDLLCYNLRSVRAYLLKKDLDALWDYVSPSWASIFIDRWTKRVMYSKLEPLKKFARMLRKHKPLILNWFKAKGQVSAGPQRG